MMMVASISDTPGQEKNVPCRNSDTSAMSSDVGVVMSNSTPVPGEVKHSSELISSEGEGSVSNLDRGSNNIETETKPSVGPSVVLAPATNASVVSDLSDNDYSQQTSSEFDSRQRRRSLTTPHAPLPRPSNSLNDFTIDKLDFASLSIYGRDAELAQIKNCFERLIQGVSERQLLLISGFSGTGKTRLAKSLQDLIRMNKTKTKGGLYARGKFDLKLRNEPYSGIIGACAEICGSILELQMNSPKRYFIIREQIKSSLGSELPLLMQVIPTLCEVIGDIDDGQSIVGSESASSSMASMTSEEAKNRFHFAFLRFIRVVADHLLPLVIVLDDLQWADLASLELLEVIIADRRNPNLLVVGIYRSNEVDKTHVFHRMLQELQNKSEEGDYFKLIKMEISHLGNDSTHRIIQDVLKCDDDANRTLGLAKVCFKKTHGNVFHLLQFLSMLHERHLLQFNFGSLKWTWDDHEIETKTSASDNVVDLLRTKMAGQPAYLVELLKVAACLGATFHVRPLGIVWEKSHSVGKPTEDSKEALVAALKMLEDGGFVSKASETASSYYWAHDKIQEAALSLVPESERPTFSSRIGEILVSELNDAELDSAIFVVADLLNRSTIVGNPTITRIKLAEINYRACMKAMRLSAFESAANYAGNGIQLLPENGWVDHYDLSLGLYSTGARSEGSIGNVKTMEEHCKAVLSREEIPIEDKFGVYMTLIDSISNGGHPEDASDIIFDIFRKFSCRLPKNSALIALGALANIIKVKVTMKSRDVTSLVRMTSKTRIGLMRLMDKLAMIQYQLKDDGMVSTIFRTLNWTIKYGYCDTSPTALANTGVIVTGVLDDIQGGSKYGEMALTLLEKLDTKATSTRVKFVVYSVLFSWTKPTRTMLKFLLENYDFGLQQGDTESATWSIYHWATFRYISGSPLETLDADILMYTKQMKDLKREQTFIQSRNVRQAVLNLRGEDNQEDPTSFIGKAWNVEEIEVAKKNPFFLAGIVTFQSTLLTYFGEHIRLADWTIELGPDFLAKVHVSSFHVTMNTFVKGVSCFAAARQTRKKRYAKLGQYFLTKIKKWLDMGNPNVKHYESLLEAELLAYKGKKFAAVKQYEVAVLLAARAGYQQDAGLASERLAEYHLTVMDDQEEATYRLREGIKYWRGWGALAKVEALEKKYADMMGQPTEVFTLTQPIPEESSNNNEI